MEAYLVMFGAGMAGGIGWQTVGWLFSLAKQRGRQGWRWVCRAENPRNCRRELGLGDASIDPAEIILWRILSGDARRCCHCRAPLL